jgi:hypothetical protein
MNIVISKMLCLTIVAILLKLLLNRGTGLT